jgi:hypothetical protein
MLTSPFASALPTERICKNSLAAASVKSLHFSCHTQNALRVDTQHDKMTHLPGKVSYLAPIQRKETELAERCHRSNEEGALGLFLQELSADLHAEQQLLKEMLERIARCSQPRIV